ncbi:sugar ABC transporter substrate-binding protein [Candidatus Sumerlaeota bacterium]|nr:sugar ABC transporter substrate-binding protein [Candidatus Sumerlaeota bacterium]
MKSFCFKVLFLICASSLLFRCASREEKTPASSQIEITFFTMQLRPTFDDYFLSLFSEFENSRPNVKIKWMDYPAQDYDTKLLTSFMGKNPPDVINIAPQSLPTYVSRQTVLPLEDLVAREVLDSYFSNIMQNACQFEGRTYAAPWYLATGVTMCNMKIFREAGLSEKDIPRSYQEMRGVARIIREKTDKFAYFPVYTEAGALKGYLSEAGVPLLDPTGKEAVFHTPKGVEVFKFWSDFYKDGLAPSEALTAMHRDPIEMYKSGRLAIFHSGPQFLKHVKADSPDVYQNTVVRSKLLWDDYETYGVDAHILAISAKSDHPELAAEFAAFVTNAENQLKFCKLTTIIPSVVKATEDPYFTNVEDTPEGQARKIAAFQVKNGTLLPTPSKNSGKLFREMDKMTEQVCLGNLTPEEGLKQLQDKWNEILKE